MKGVIAVLGVGMHKWGKWGDGFLHYGIHAAHLALKDAGVRWQDIQFLASGATVRNGYSGLVAGATFARALGWQGAEVSTSYAGCASGGHAIAAARAKILTGECDVALVVAADTASEGLVKPIGTDRPERDEDWVRHYLGLSNPCYLGLFARRRMHLYGTTEADFNTIRIKNSVHGALNPYARFRTMLTTAQISRSPMYADPLRLFHIASTADGGAALVLSSDAFARRCQSRAVRLVSISTATPQFPSSLEMPYLAADCTANDRAQEFRHHLSQSAYEGASMSPQDISLAEIYDLSSAMELDWYEHLSLCGRGQAEDLVRTGVTALGGRLPVNVSGGLSCMGEAMAAQVVAQVCELTWQLRGQAEGRQVQDAQVGIAAAHGIYGHGTAVILRRE
jgi:acetyl-CoA acetyltransferase